MTGKIISYQKHFLEKCFMINAENAFKYDILGSQVPGESIGCAIGKMQQVNQ